MIITLRGTKKDRTIRIKSESEIRELYNPWYDSAVQRDVVAFSAGDEVVATGYDTTVNDIVLSPGFRYKHCVPSKYVEGADEWLARHGIVPVTVPGCDYSPVLDVSKDRVQVGCQSFEVSDLAELYTQLALYFQDGR